MTRQDNTPKAVEDCHRLIAWFIPQIDKFPRVRRYTLGERIETGLLEVLEHLLTAAFSRNKTEPLRAANLRLDMLRHLWRLAHELGVRTSVRQRRGRTKVFALLAGACDRILPAHGRTKVRAPRGGARTACGWKEGHGAAVGSAPWPFWAAQW